MYVSQPWSFLYGFGFSNTHKSKQAVQANKPLNTPLLQPGANTPVKINLFRPAIKNINKPAVTIFSLDKLIDNIQ
jgi:hypothetical protein